MIVPITDSQIQRFQKYFQIIEEIHTIELGKVNFTDEKLQNFLDGTTSWNTTFAKTSRGCIVVNKDKVTALQLPSVIIQFAN